MAPDLRRVLRAEVSGQAMQAINQLSPNLTVQDLKAAFAYLQKDPEVDSAKISAVGSLGGWRSFMLERRSRAVPSRRLQRATPHRVLKTSMAPVLGNYAQYDFRVTGNAIWTEKTMHDAERNLPITCIRASTMRSTAQARNITPMPPSLPGRELWIS